MPRQFAVDLTVQLSAEEALRVHRDFDFMHFTTQQDGQAVALQSEEETCDQGEARVVRVFNMVFVIDPIPSGLRGLVSREKVQPVLREEWWPARNDEERPIHFTSTVPFFGHRLKVEGRQWFSAAPDGSNSCTYSARATVTSALVPGFNSLIEKEAISKLEHAVTTFCDRAPRFLGQQRRDRLPQGPDRHERAAKPPPPLPPPQPAPPAPPPPQPPQPPPPVATGRRPPVRPLRSASLESLEPWVPVQDFLEGASAVMAAPMQAAAGSAPLSTALQLDELSEEAPVPCSCFCVLYRQLSACAASVSTSYTSLSTASTPAASDGPTPPPARKASIGAPTAAALQRGVQRAVERGVQLARPPARVPARDPMRQGLRLAPEDDDFGEIVE